jgi:cytochrome c553
MVPNWRKCYHDIAIFDKMMRQLSDINLEDQGMNFSKIALFAVALLGAAYAHAADDAANMATQVCAACHGADGNSPIALNPKLAGQHPEYITKQLKDFKSGKRKNAVMGGIAATLSAQDMIDLGIYSGAQTASNGKARSNGAGSVGEKIYRGGIADTGVPACASCHGPAGAGVPVQFPRLAGQHADYTLAQMKAFRTGERANAPMMRTIAAKMTDQDMAAVADYIQGLR